MTPIRIQRQRTKGWRMPEGAIYVGRPTVYGNPFKVGADHPWYQPGQVIITPQFAVDLFAAHMAVHPEMRDAIREALRGRDLVCWCPVGRPCHANVLLEIANQPEMGG